MKDTIYREDAIEAVKGNSYANDDYIEINGYGAIKDISALPSADRPQDDDWEKYSDKLWKNAYERGKEEEHRWWSEHCAKCTDADRPQGKWYKDENGDYRCSECGGCEEQFIYGTENWYGRGESKFCPSCGARMKGASDD